MPQTNQNKDNTQSEKCMQAWLAASTLTRILASSAPAGDFSRFVPRAKK